MPETFRYRGHFRWARFFFLGMALFPPALLVLTRHSFHPIMLVPTGLVVAECLFFAWLMHRLARTEIELTEDALVQRIGKKTTCIPLDSIQRLDMPSIRYAGGWMKVRSSLATIRVPITLKDVSILVERLADRVDARAYDPKKLAGFMRTAVVADHSWDRLEENRGKVLLVALSVAGVVVVAGLGSMLGALVALLPALIYFGGEILLILDFRKRANAQGAPRRPGRNRALEQKLFARALPAALVVATLALAVQGALLVTARAEPTPSAEAHRCL